MDAEQQKARQLADLLDDFRPEEGLTVEEREFLKLREHMQALQISRLRIRMDCGTFLAWCLLASAVYCLAAARFASWC